MLLKQHRLNCKSLSFRLEYRGIVTEPIVKFIPKLNGKKYLLVFNMFLVVSSTYIPFVFFIKSLVSLFLLNEGIILTPPFFLFLNYKCVCVCVCVYSHNGLLVLSYLSSSLLFPFANCNIIKFNISRS